MSMRQWSTSHEVPRLVAWLNNSWTLLSINQTCYVHVNCRWFFGCCLQFQLAVRFGVTILAA